MYFILSRPTSTLIRNEILPFEDANSIEFLCGKNDTSLFALGNHTKKRPHNLVLVSIPHFSGALANLVLFLLFVIGPHL
jgi:hypothetical protein